MDVTALLSRLAKVRSAGPGKWTACCPAHGDKTPSLAIRLMDDGRILLHDFGGCDVSAVLGALGITVSDLFERPLYHRARKVQQPFTAHDALRCLRREVGVAALAAAEIACGVKHTPEDVIRILDASDRISEAANYVAQL